MERPIGQEILFEMNSEKICLEVALKPHTKEEIPLKLKVYAVGSSSNSKHQHYDSKYDILKSYGIKGPESSDKDSESHSTFAWEISLLMEVKLKLKKDERETFVSGVSEVGEVSNASEAVEKKISPLSKQFDKNLSKNWKKGNSLQIS
ncbi:hypothetical protein CEXT_373401 [Caerostris extrusa]|uniref:Uncharacterized protein n=1 Tax=Caerostris extrusa TaxID=172846 RepID=A0AAV4S683_CAEEX|nr:hypothetical protein CEXT_373401 [Caerostris extrusa]